MRRRATTCARDRNDIFEHFFYIKSSLSRFFDDLFFSFFFNSNPKNKSKERKKHDEGEKEKKFQTKKKKDPEKKITVTDNLHLFLDLIFSTSTKVLPNRFLQHSSLQHSSVHHHSSSFLQGVVTLLACRNRGVFD
jgi:hypothetical protein